MTRYKYLRGLTPPQKEYSVICNETRLADSQKEAKWDSIADSKTDFFLTKKSEQPKKVAGPYKGTWMARC